VPPQDREIRSELESRQRGTMQEPDLSSSSRVLNTWRGMSGAHEDRLDVSTSSPIVRDKFADL
jgi:hypothetical protein